MNKHVLVIYNPSVRSQVETEVWIARLLEKLNEKEKYLVSFFSTSKDTEPFHLMPLIAAPLDLVIAAGGDGTVRLTLSALAKLHSRIPCAILPIGTGNVLARNLGIVENGLLSDPLKYAFEYISSGRSIPIDLGFMNGEHFAGMAGVGPLSDAFLGPKREQKSRTKLWAYAACLIATIARAPIIFKISCAEESFLVNGAGVFISNVQTLGLGAEPDLAKLVDGRLDLHIVNPRTFLGYLHLIKRYACGAKDSAAPEHRFTVKEVLIEVASRRGARSLFQKLASVIELIFFARTPGKSSTGKNLQCMIDGDPAGSTPMRVTVKPQAVHVLVPKVTFSKYLQIINRRNHGNCDEAIPLREAFPVK